MTFFLLYNCYKKCENYYYFDSIYNYHCTNNLSCPNDYPKLISETHECIKEEEILKFKSTEVINKEFSTKVINEKFSTEVINEEFLTEAINEEFITFELIKTKTDCVVKIDDIENIINDILNNEKNETKEKNKEEEIKAYDKIIYNVEDIFTSGNYDTSNLDKGEDQVIKTEKLTITLTTTQNQKNNTDTNMTLLDLGECETLLRGHYNISDNEFLYMKKMDIKQEGMKIPKIEYDVYYKENEISLSKKVNSSSKC